MRQRINLHVSMITVIILAISCNRPNCENSNPILAAYDINSEEYKAELMQQIETIGKENLTYWFESYTQENDNDYIVVNIQNDSICAKGKFLVIEWGKIEGIRNTKGRGYSGAELRGLAFHVEQAPNKTVFVYDDLTTIVD